MPHEIGTSSTSFGEVALREDFKPPGMLGRDTVPGLTFEVEKLKRRIGEKESGAHSSRFRICMLIHGQGRAGYGKTKAEQDQGNKSVPSDLESGG